MIYKDYNNIDDSILLLKLENKLNDKYAWQAFIHKIDDENLTNYVLDKYYEQYNNFEYFLQNCTDNNIISKHLKYTRDEIDMILSRQIYINIKHIEKYCLKFKYKLFNDNVYSAKLWNYNYLTEDFIRKYSQYANWDVISYRNLSDEFIEENREKINWNNLCEFKKMDNDFIAKNIDKISKCKYILLLNNTQINFNQLLRNDTFVNLFSDKEIMEKIDKINSYIFPNDLSTYMLLIFLKKLNVGMYNVYIKKYNSVAKLYKLKVV